MMVKPPSDQKLIWKISPKATIAKSNTSMVTMEVSPRNLLFKTVQANASLLSCEGDLIDKE